MHFTVEPSATTLERIFSATSGDARGTCDHGLIFIFIVSILSHTDCEPVLEHGCTDILQRGRWARRRGDRADMVGDQLFAPVCPKLSHILTLYSYVGRTV